MTTSAQIFDAQFLQMRERCLSLAADFDRVGRAAGGWDALANDSRAQELRRAVAILLDGSEERARRVLENFSDHSTDLK